ncbi:hypothetical protein PFY12_06010 [Chryseobacterium camelliae]|uniref:Uncharacterized protein n=1 Tax=Chryseobacterium camelliae TaxID=1265445 RepID=A0ABY7QS81_9FLAO|nr:hypothetical protein [Chryseobacterium camelliae]WBV61673.1 hypothetical protein PFY12_06010 [Chryseobacterium camelliae]
MKEKTTIQIDRNIPKSILTGFILAFLTVFASEHFSTFSYIPNLNTPSIDNEGKLILSGTYDPTTTPVGALYQTTPFGTKIDLPTNGMMCSQLLYDSEFKSYSNKGVLYAKSVFSDYKYLLLFWIAYTLIVLFFKRYRLKVLILILPILGINCNKSKHEPTRNCIRPIDTAKTDSNTTNAITPQNTSETNIKHSFVVFKVKDKYFGKESVIVTGIFNTPYTIKTDEEYMILDDTQAKCNAYLFDKNILERYMMRFDSYAEASQEKERISNIRNTTTTQSSVKEKWTPKTLTKEEQEQIIRDWKSITPEEHKEAERMQTEYEIWENEQKRNYN